MVIDAGTFKKLVLTYAMFTQYHVRWSNVFYMQMDDAPVYVIIIAIHITFVFSFSRAELHVIFI